MFSFTGSLRLFSWSIECVSAQRKICISYQSTYVHKYQKHVFGSNLKLADTCFVGHVFVLCRLKFYFKGGFISVFWGVAFILYVSRAVPPDFCFTNIRVKKQIHAANLTFVSSPLPFQSTLGMKDVAVLF